MDKYYFKKNKRNLIILDDLINEASKSLKITQLFTRGRHNNIFVIYLTLNLFCKNQRAISLNSNYMVIFRNTRDNSQFATIEGQIHPDIVKFLIWAYKDATPSLHTDLMLDFKSGKRYRMRSIILEDPQHVYIAHRKRKRIICKVTMVLSACLRTLRRIWLC